MKRFFTSLAFLIIATGNIRAQQVIHACCDTAICTPGASVTLQATIDSGLVQGTILNIQDDTYSQIVDLGFTFDFFGISHTQCVLSTNAYISFELSEANQYSEWVIDAPAPDPSIAANTIMGPWHDTDPSVSGTVSFATFGVAPNRFFVYSFCDVAMFDCNDVLFTGQMILYETSNIIDIMLLQKNTCPSWNDEAAIEGLIDPTGNIAYIIPGRNYPDVWTAYNDGYRFTPNGSGGYTFAPESFYMVPFQAGNPVWTDINGNPEGNGFSIIVNPTVTTSYIVGTGSCGSSTDTVTVTVGTLPTIYNQLNASCPNSTDGALFATPTSNTGPFDFVWQDAGGGNLQTTNNVSTDSLFNLGPGTYTVYITDSLGCTATHTFTITTGNLNSIYSQQNALCYSSSTGYAVADPSPGNNYNFVWQNSSGATVQTHNGYAVDTLHNLQPGTYTVTITSPLGCSTSHIFTITSGTANASFTVSPIPICDGSTANFNSTSTASGTTITGYHWNFGDSQTSVLQNPTHNYAQTGTYTVQLIITVNGGCKDTVTQTVTVLPNINAAFSSQPPTEACAGQPILFEDQSDRNPVSWSWSFGGDGTSNQENTIHIFNQPGNYTVQLTVNDSLCGTSTVSHDITINYVPDPYIGSDTIICIYESLEFHANAVGQSYSWSTGAITEGITVSPPGPATYVVSVNNHGCIGTDTVQVFINCTLYMPNAFSPNGDGVNDIFRPRGAKITSFTMKIFDRWGQEIYDETNNSITKGWDGTFKGLPQEIGVYVYYIDATFVNSEHQTQQGNISLVR